MNKFIAYGCITKDPEMYTIRDGQFKLAKFTVAINEYRGGKETTIFMPCAAWRTLAETVEKFAKKGTKVIVTGRLTSDTYTNKSGVSITTYCVDLDDLQLISKRKRQDGTEFEDEFTVTQEELEPIPEEEGLPF